ncbi:multicopper oxidase family protein [Stenotrophomonas sp. LGBM10]|uniref:multicopper oxidase family protein n=1 Tax=Stenotrophomonas sp. LGBM10 TaxID=3390038 RepID=UPI00398B84B8
MDAILPVPPTDRARRRRRLHDLYAVVLAGALLWTGATVAQAPSSGNAAGAPLRPPAEIRYGADGVSRGTLRAALSPVSVGDQPYRALVFNGDYDAPLIRTRPGGTVAITLDNRMDEKTNLHFHGMTVTPLDSGDSIFREVGPHQTGLYRFKLPPDHSPGAYWYHSHFHGGAQRQVESGIAGPILVDGILDPFPELKGIKERVLVLRNFQKTTTGKLASAIVTSAPSIRTVNGQRDPVIDIQPGETQLWHLLNISANQYFRIRIAGQNVQILSRDGNTVNKRVTTDELLIGPSARFSVLVVGPAAGDHPVELAAGNTGAAGDQYKGARIATLRAGGAAVATRAITSPYPVLEDLSRVAVANVRQFAFQDSATDGDAFLINGERFDPRRVNTTVKLGDVEEWRLYNPSQELHQFHIHQTDFQVVAINGKPVPFSGYRDTVYIPTRGSITLRIPFRDPVMLGKFVYHCHILEHEDGGMMQVIQVVRPEDYAQAVKLAPLGGIYGDNQTCTYLKNSGREFTLPASVQLPAGEP